MRYIIDRINGEIAVCEDEEGDFVKVSATELPDGVKEGDVIKKEDDIWYKDEKESCDRRQAMKEKLDRLME